MYQAGDEWQGYDPEDLVMCTQWDQFLPSRKPQMLFVFSTKPSIFCINKVWPTPGLIVLLVISEISCCYLLTRNLWKLEKWVASRCELLQPAAVGENMSLSIPSNLIPSNPIYSNPIPSQPIPWLSGPVPVRSLPHPGEAHRSGGWLRIHLGWTRGAWDRYFGHGIEWYRPPSNLSPVNFG